MTRTPLRFPDASKQHPAAIARRKVENWLTAVACPACKREAIEALEHAGVGTADDARRAGTKFYLCRESGELKGVGG